MFPMIAARFDLISIGDAMHSVCDDANEMMTADGRNLIPPAGGIFLFIGVFIYVARFKRISFL